MSSPALIMAAPNAFAASALSLVTLNVIPRVRVTKSTDHSSACRRVDFHSGVMKGVV